MKRVLIILAIILVLGGIIYAGYYLSSKKAATSPEAPSGALPAPAGTLPEATSTTGETPSVTGPVGTGGVIAGLSLVSSEKFSAFGIATSGIVLGVSPDGKIFSVDQKGASSFLSSAPIDSFSGGSFSSDAAKLLAFWGTNDNRQFSVFDISTKSWQPLPLGTVSAAWKPNTHVLAYLQDKNGAKTLYTWDLDKPKTKATSVVQLFAEDLSVGFVGRDKISIADKSTGLFRGSLFVYDTKKKTFSPIITDVYGLSVKWNSTGTESLAFSGNTNGAGGYIRLADFSGKTINQLQFLTLPEKCLFSADVFATSTVSTSTKVLPPAPPETFLYCAIPRPQRTFSSATLPDDYLKLKVFTSDSIYRIDTESGLITSVFDDQNKSLDVSQPAISGTKLFFLNRYDQNLYALPIPKG